MTDEQKFAGFAPIDGNFTMTPNQVYSLMPGLNGSELKCILYIVRHTFGFHEIKKRITLDEFVNGRKKRDGSRMDTGTGLNKDTVVNALQSLADGGYIVIEADDTDAARKRRVYALRMSENPTSESENPTSGGKNSDIDQRNKRNKDTPRKKKDSKAAHTGGGSPRPRNEIFDAIVKAARLDANGLTKAMAKAIGTASADLKGAGFTPADVPLIYQYCVDSGFKNFGPMALAKHAPDWRAKNTNKNAAPVREKQAAPRAPLNREAIDAWNRERLEIARKIRTGELPKDTPVPPKPEPVFADDERTE